MNELNQKPKNRFKRWIPRPNIRSIRRAVKEESSGGVVYRRLPTGVEILLIEDSKGRWTIPKGHIEKGEKNSETAIREITEETGLKEMRIISWLGKTDFQYRRGDSLVMMVVDIFLIEALGNTSQIKAEDSEGIKGVKWFSIKEAIELMEYDNINKLLLIALKKIRNSAH